MHEVGEREERLGKDSDTVQRDAEGKLLLSPRLSVCLSLSPLRPPLCGQKGRHMGSPRIRTTALGGN